ncbi:MAG: hypothetical protein GTO03_02415 [Planctomycetales bacterium]|nr:hypothetical protein [Planctomycetales bacterium]
MKWSLYPFIIYATLLAAFCYADGPWNGGYETYLPSTAYAPAAVQPVAYPPPSTYPVAYDPFGPPVYSSWNSSRCYDCTGVWAGYGCHEFKGPKGHGCRRHKFGCKGGCRGHHHTAGCCLADGCTVTEPPVGSDPVESVPADDAAAPTAAPTADEEKSASRSSGWPQTVALFPPLNN